MATPNRQPKYNESRRGDPRGRPKIKTIPQTVDQNNIEEGQPQGIAPTKNPTEKTVGEIVGAFKSITTVEYIRGIKNNNWQAIDKRLWQRNYHEHIIRNAQSYIHISNYITNNPAHWDKDVLQ